MDLVSVQELSSEQGLALLKAALNVGALFGFILYRFVNEGDGRSPLTFQAFPPDVLRSRILAILEDLNRSLSPSRSPRKSSRSINHLLKLLLNHNNPLPHDYVDSISNEPDASGDEGPEELVTEEYLQKMLQEEHTELLHLEQEERTPELASAPDTAAFDRLADAMFQVTPASLAVIITLLKAAPSNQQMTLCETMRPALQKGQIVASFVTCASLIYAWAKLPSANRITTTQALQQAWLNNGKPCVQHSRPSSAPPAAATTHGILLVKKHAEYPRVPPEVSITFDPSNSNNMQKGKVVDSMRGPLIKSIVSSPELHVFPSFFQAMDDDKSSVTIRRSTAAVTSASSTISVLTSTTTKTDLFRVTTFKPPFNKRLPTMNKRTKRPWSFF